MARKRRGDIQSRLTRRTPEPIAETAIDRLMTSATGDVQASDLDLKAIRLDRIVPDPDQPRRDIPGESLAELAASIKEQGVLQPVEVDYDPDQDVYVLVHGERRWRAAQMAGLETIPAIIKPSPLDRATRLIRQLIENIQREDLNDVDRARALVALRGQMQAALDAKLEAEQDVDSDKATWKTQITWSQVGERVGISRARMSQLRALLDLPETIREDVRQGKLTERDARLYRGLPPEQQVELHQVKQEQSLATDQLQEAATILKAEAQTSSPRSVQEVIEQVTTPPPLEPSIVPPPTLPATAVGPAAKVKAPAYRTEPTFQIPPVPPAAPPPLSMDTLLRLIEGLSPLETLRLLTRVLIGLQLKPFEIDAELHRAVAALGDQVERLRQETGE